jgi:hypothetical protein
MNLAFPRAGNWHGNASLLIFLDNGMRAFAAGADQRRWMEVDAADAYDTAVVMVPETWRATLAPTPFTPEMLALDQQG